MIMAIYTYNDLIAQGDDEKKRIAFIGNVIENHKRSEAYKWAVDADNYIKQKNTTIMEYVKFLYTIKGNAVPDNYSANHKTASNFYKRFVTQEIEYLLANGIQFADENVKAKLGGSRFDRLIKKMAKQAVNGGVCFGFWNLDHIDMFKITEFAPLYDEEDGAMKAGVRFWKLASNKPLRATLYELDGYTEYKEDDDKGLLVYEEKRPYKLKISESLFDGTQIYDGENYPTFPIVPLWGNDEHQSKLVGLKTEIDCYDLIKSGFANDLDDVSQIFWVLRGASGMDEADIAKFLDQLKRLKATVLDDDDVQADAHTLEIPYQAREAYLNRLEQDMYYDAMAMNPKDLTGGNVTATAIKAAYDNLDHEANELKGCVEDFIADIIALAGITAEDTEPIFKVKRISNDTEQTSSVLQAAQYLDTQTILEKLPFIDTEEVEAILGRVQGEEIGRYQAMIEQPQEATEQA